MLRDLAGMIARAGGGDVVFELPDEVERAGYSTATRAVMDASRVRAKGWRACYGLRDGLERTIRILRSTEE
jgi:nucleoside-diphosphate-sugar epimerase